LDKFIDSFVLCGTCKNPETVLRVKKNSISFRCNACGNSTPVNMSHKLSKFILNNPPKPQEEADNHIALVDRNLPLPEKQKDDGWSVDTSPEAIAARRHELVGNSGLEVFQQEEGAEHEPIELVLAPGQDPVPLLKKFWNSGPSLDSVRPKVQELQKSQGWTDRQILSLVFGSLFDSNLEKDFSKKAELMSQFVAGPKDQKALLCCLEKLCKMESSLVPKMSGILQNFYNQNLLEDDTVFDWFEEPNKSIPAELYREIRAKSKEFVDWLQNASSGDD